MSYKREQFIENLDSILQDIDTIFILDRGDLPECGIYLQYIDCFCAFNILMNLINMKMDGKVYDLDIMTHSRKPIPEEEWMREYNRTKMLAEEGIL